MSIRKNTMYNLIGAVLPMGLSLVITPKYIAMVGDTRYGVLALAWLLLGYFGLFDLGLGRATAQRIAELEKGSAAQRAESFLTALVMNSGLGVLGGLILWPVASFLFSGEIHVDADIYPELKASIIWLVVCVPVATLSGVLTGALQGRSKFLELNLFSVTNAIALQLVPLFVAWLQGPNLASLLAAVVLTRIIGLLFLSWRCRVHLLKGQPLVVSMAQAKALLRFGGWVTVTSVVGPLMVALDRFVIGVVSGAKTVTYYTVPYQLSSASTVLPNALTSALFPRLASADATDRKMLADTATRSMVTIMTPIMLFGVFIMKPFLHLWLGPKFAELAALSGQILLFGFWINGFAFIPYAQLQAAGRPDLVAKCHLAEVLPYWAILFLSMQYFGLPGAAFAFSLRTTADCLLLMYLSGSLKAGLRILWLPGSMIFFGQLVASNFEAESVEWWLGGAGLVVCSVAWAWLSAPINLRNFISG